MISISISKSNSDSDSDSDTIDWVYEDAVNKGINFLTEEQTTSSNTIVDHIDTDTDDDSIDYTINTGSQINFIDIIFIILFLSMITLPFVINETTVGFILGKHSKTSHDDTIYFDYYPEQPDYYPEQLTYYPEQTKIDWWSYYNTHCCLVNSTTNKFNPNDCYASGQCYDFIGKWLEENNQTFYNSSWSQTCCYQYRTIGSYAYDNYCSFSCLNTIKNTC